MIRLTDEILTIGYKTIRYKRESMLHVDIWKTIGQYYQNHKGI